jgi:hypothetical protein
MAHVDQLLQIDLKHLPLWLLRLALGLHCFSPVFRQFCYAFREILEQTMPHFISFYTGFVGFSVILKLSNAGLRGLQGEHSVPCAYQAPFSGLARSLLFTAAVAVPAKRFFNQLVGMERPTEKVSTAPAKSRS